MEIYKASKSPYKVLKIIPTGFPQFDKILGVGGIPTRKITEISGPWSVGKSTMGLSIVAQAQKMGMDCLWIDTEYSWSEDYAQKLGIDIDSLDVMTERFAEQTFDSTLEWAESHKKALIVLDSIGGLLPRAEAEKTSDGKIIGGQAKLVATFCRKMVPLMAINDIGMIVLNHEFTDLMSGKLMTSGGVKLAHHKSIWVRFKKANKRLMQGENQVGEVIEVEVRKNKVAGTVRQTCELNMMYGEGFNKEAHILDQALEKGVIIKKGNSYFIGEEKIAVGMAKLREAFKDESFTVKVKELLV